MCAVCRVCAVNIQVRSGLGPLWGWPGSFICCCETCINFSFCKTTSFLHNSSFFASPSLGRRPKQRIRLLLLRRPRPLRLLRLRLPLLLLINRALEHSMRIRILVDHAPRRGTIVPLPGTTAAAWATTQPPEASRPPPCAPDRRPRWLCGAHYSRRGRRVPGCIGRLSSMCTLHAAAVRCRVGSVKTLIITQLRLGASLQ